MLKRNGQQEIGTFRKELDRHLERRIASALWLGLIYDRLKDSWIRRYRNGGWDRPPFRRGDRVQVIPRRDVGMQSQQDGRAGRYSR